jgi:hypothetical protein
MSAVRSCHGPGRTLNSAAGLPARVQIPVFPEPPLVFSHELLGGLRTGFLVFPLYEWHVYSSKWNEAEALSEYGVVTE